MHKNIFPIIRPQVIQLDTTNVCNLDLNGGKGCIYCNIHRTYHIKPNYMKKEIAEKFFIELENIGWNKYIVQYRPYIYGDMLCESIDRFNYFIDLGFRYLPNARIIILTNGADSKKANRFMNPLIDELHISVSASNDETYQKIHSLPLFNEVMKTYNYIMGEPDRPSVYVHFICNYDNMNDLDKWKEIFSDAEGQFISPMHYSNIQTASLELSKLIDMDKIYEIGNICNVKKLSPWMVCNLWNNLAISSNGEYLQCCDVLPEYNYGKVGEISIKEMWKKRLYDGLDSYGCDNCNLRKNNYKKIVNITKKWYNITGIV